MEEDIAINEALNLVDRRRQEGLYTGRVLGITVGLCIDIGLEVIINCTSAHGEHVDIDFNKLDKNIWSAKSKQLLRDANAGVCFYKDK